MLFGTMLFLAIFFLTACNQSSMDIQPAPVANEVDFLNAASSKDNGRLPTADAVELTLWTPTFFNPDPEGSNAASDILRDAYVNFEATHPNVSVNVEPKSEQGGATLYEYISSAYKVAPSILPDIIMLDSQQLWAIADLGLIPPLSAEEVTALDDVYPFAQEAVAYKDNIYGIPYVANILHTVQVRTGAADVDVASIPSTWSALFESNVPYFFPAGGRNGRGNDTLLLQYVGAGGELTNDKSLMNSTALVDVLEFVSQGIKRQLIPRNVIDFSDVDSAWLSLGTTQRGFVEISSTLYLQQRPLIGGSSFSATPTKSGERVTIGRVWAFAILSQEPERRALALELIDKLAAPAVLGPWGLSASRLPVHRAALNSWGNGDAYYDFVRDELEAAVALPNGTSFVGFSADIHQALLAVLSGEITPEEAVANIENQ